MNPSARICLDVGDCLGKRLVLLQHHEQVNVIVDSINCNNSPADLHDEPSEVSVYSRADIGSEPRPSLSGREDNMINEFCVRVTQTSHPTYYPRGERYDRGMNAASVGAIVPGSDQIGQRSKDVLTVGVH